MSQLLPGMEDDDLYPIALLIDELKHDDVKLRLDAMNRLPDIAAALGPEKTREQLIPFLDESVEDEDEVLHALATKLGESCGSVGGPEYAHLLLKPLETLAAIEEPVVRDEAVKSINIICEQIPAKNVELYVLPVIHKLANSDWFATKVSATGLFASAYPRVSKAAQEQLRDSFQALVTGCSDSPMVQRAAARNLPAFVTKLDNSNALQIVLMFNNLGKHEQESVRLLVIEIFISIAEHLGPELDSDVSTILSERIVELFKDKAWRVRYMVAQMFEKVARAVSKLRDERLEGQLPTIFNNLLADTEAEVRAAIAAQIPGFLQFLKSKNANLPLSKIDSLLMDSSQHVRANAALHLSALAPILGKEATIEHLVPTFSQILDDPAPEVRLNFISNLKLATDVIGISFFSDHLLPAIRKLASDSKWRVRMAIIEYIPSLASQLEVEYFNSQLGDACHTWLTDSVYSIREAATLNLQKLTEVYGVEWADKNLLPRIQSLAVSPDHTSRMTTCFAYMALAPCLSLPVLKKCLVSDPHAELDPTLAGLARDRIPNIQFNVAKAYGRMIEILQKLPDETTTIYSAEQSGTTDRLVGSEAGMALITQAILPNLKALESESDVDVKNLAKEALQLLRKDVKSAAGSIGDAMEQ